MKVLSRVRKYEFPDFSPDIFTDFLQLYWANFSNRIG